jgi:hypothetical protein
VTTDKLEIERKDLFASNEYSFIFPIFGWLVFQEFNEANFNWMRKMKPNWEVPDIFPARYFVDHSGLSQKTQKMLERLINFLWGDGIESWLKKKQIARIMRNPLTQKSGAYVEATDQNLIFLPEPQGVRIEKEWQKRIKDSAA